MDHKYLVEKRKCPNCGRMYPIYQTLHRCNSCGTIYCGNYGCIGKIGEGSCPNPNCNSNSASPAVFDPLKNTWS